MNHCMLMAEITVGPELRYTQDNQTAIAELTVVFPGIRAEDPTQQMKVIGWGNLAQEIQEQYQVGDRVLIEGRLTMNTVDRPEGFKEKQAELTAQKIHRLSDLSTSDISKPVTAVATGAGSAAPAAPASRPPAAPPAKTAPAAVSEAEPEVDYDDIPF
ncbi:MAG: single-stranded DNA-binding protein [Cyanobacteria bacterium P01_F01_bin.86]